MSFLRRNSGFWTIRSGNCVWQRSARNAQKSGVRRRVSGRRLSFTDGNAYRDPANRRTIARWILLPSSVFCLLSPVMLKEIEQLLVLQDRDQSMRAIQAELATVPLEQKRIDQL